MSVQAQAARARGGWSVRRLLGLCLLLQAAIGAAVVFEGSRGLLPELRFGPSVPDFVPGAPVQPDDQRRRFRPTDLPAAPGPLTGPKTPRDMPQTLTTELVKADGRQVLKLTGAIDEAATDRVRELLGTADPSPESVELHSPGGLVHIALELGKLMRAADLKVSVNDGAICLSACPYILAGGTQRLVSDTASVGVHQSYYDTAVYLPLFVGVSNIQQGEAEAMRYLIDMGIDPLIRIPALETPPSEIYLLTTKELMDYRLATKIRPSL